MKTKKGFTLIELLIVIAIIGILSAALLPTILNAPARGRDAARIGQINSLVAALEAYNSDNGHYPNEAGEVAGECASAAFGTAINTYFSGGAVPKDPSGNAPAADSDAGIGGCNTSAEYYYKYIGDIDVAEYIIATKMEFPSNNNTDDVPATEIKDGGTAIDFTTCGADCDYYVQAH